MARKERAPKAKDSAPPAQAPWEPQKKEPARTVQELRLVGVPVLDRATRAEMEAAQRLRPEQEVVREQASPRAAPDAVDQGAGQVLRADRAEAATEQMDRSLAASRELPVSP